MRKGSLLTTWMYFGDHVEFVAKTVNVLFRNPRLAQNTFGLWWKAIQLDGWHQVDVVGLVGPGRVD